MIPINQSNRIDEILDEYNEYVLNLNVLPPEDEAALHLQYQQVDICYKLRGEFMQICDDLAEPSLPITPVLSPDADGNLRPDWDMNL
jgi:hypothetical protein